jgi:histidinol-phosphate aminotransferase
MAGARLGFGFADKEIINDIIRIKYSTNPYNVNRMTASAGIGALKDKDYFLRNVQRIIKNREYVIKELRDLGFICTDSKANFVFAKSDLFKGDALYKALKEKGILIRHFDKERIKDYNRITIGDENQMKTFIQTIKEIL